jgi:hypothetical protein
MAEEISEVVDYEMMDIDEADDNKDELHTYLDRDLKFTLNSINVLCGQTGAGKSRFVFKEIAKLKYLEHPYHQFVYVCDEENDKTFIKYRPLISVPIVKISYAEACNRLKNIVASKNAYEKIINAEKNKKFLPLSGKEKGVILDYLGVKDFSIPILHTLILFDDATDIFTNKKDLLNDMILRNRHHKFTYFFNIHSFTCKALPMKIKKSMRSLRYFGGYSKLDFNHSYQQWKCP